MEWLQGTWFHISTCGDVLGWDNYLLHSSTTLVYPWGHKLLCTMMLVPFRIRSQFVGIYIIYY